MARRTAKPEAPALGGRGMKRGLVRTIFSVTPEQLEALRAEATRRMVSRGRGRIDAGEVLREALDAWMRKRK